MLPTTEQKIDYIYESVKKREKSEKTAKLLKWGFRIFMIIYLYYFITIGLPTLMKNFIPALPSFGGSSESSSTIDIDSLDPGVIESALEKYLNN